MVVREDATTWAGLADLPLNGYVTDVFLLGARIRAALNSAFCDDTMLVVRIITTDTMLSDRYKSP